MSINKKIKIVRMPSLSPTMTTGKLHKWIMKIGDKVAMGDVLAEVETDKAVMEMEAADAGVLRRILMQDGTENVAIETPIAVIAPADASDEEIDAVLGGSGGNKEVKLDMHRVGGYKREVDKVHQTHVPEQLPEQGRIRISPYAKLLANQNNIDYKGIQGTGKDGSIVAQDVELVMQGDAQGDVHSNVHANAQYSNQPQPHQQHLAYTIQQTRIVPMSSMRKAISAKVTHAKQTIPHFYVSAEIDMTNILQLKNELMQMQQIKTTLNDWFVLGCAKALQEVPQLNWVWQKENESLIENKDVNINCAIDVGSGPILALLRQVQIKTLRQINNDMNDIVERAKNKQLTPGDMMHGTFSISNLGMFGVSHFQAIINAPQVAMLAIGGLDRDNFCTVSLACDHRALDGRDAALFLKALKQIMQMPILMIA